MIHPPSLPLLHCTYVCECVHSFVHWLLALSISLVCDCVSLCIPVLPFCLCRDSGRLLIFKCSLIQIQSVVFPPLRASAQWQAWHGTVCKMSITVIKDLCRNQYRTLQTEDVWHFPPLSLMHLLIIALKLQIKTIFGLKIDWELPGCRFLLWLALCVFMHVHLSVQTQMHSLFPPLCAFFLTYTSVNNSGGLIVSGVARATQRRCILRLVRVCLYA